MNFLGPTEEAHVNLYIFSKKFRKGEEAKLCSFNDIIEPRNYHMTPHYASGPSSLAW